MAEPPACQVYWGDLLLDTAHMTHEEFGAYMRLLGHSWRERGLPNDEARLQKILALSSHKWKKLWPVIAEKFSVVDGRLVNPRQERERAKQASYRAAQSKKGAKGASARWGAGNGTGMARAVPSRSPDDTSSSSTSEYIDNQHISEPSTSPGENPF